MKKIIKISLILAAAVFSIFVIFYIYWPFAQRFINTKSLAGDATMHLANIISFSRNHPFPIIAWKVEWAGYPVVEGYPWLHYYLIQPLLSFFKTPGIAMDYYSAVFLLVYYIVSFLLLFYVSKNVFLALLFSLVLIYGADSQMPFSVNAFMTFTSSQFFLPLILLLTILAREKNNLKLFLLSSVLLAISFYAHGSMTGIVILPIIFPFLILNTAGKITKESIFTTIRFFFVFILISSIQIYQFIDYNAQGYLRGVKPFPLDVIPSRFANLMSWENPILLPLLIIFVPFFIIAAKKSFSRIKPYFFSLIFIIFIFTLMLFNITSMNLVLLAERVLWGLSLMFLLLFAKVIAELTNSSLGKSILFGSVGLVITAAYLFLTLIVKPAHLVPDTLRNLDPYKYKPDESLVSDVANSDETKYSDKYEYESSYPPLSWSKSFDNYRADGINWAIYSNWNLWSSNPRYKGRFPAAKGLPLEWSGLLTAAEYGHLGEAGTPDTSKWAVNQTIFFFDWYAIRHLEVVEVDWPDFLRKEPLIVSTEKSRNIAYHTIDKKYIGPVYAPTNVKTMAVVSPETQYDNFIRTLSYSEFTSKRLIPIYLGSNLDSLNKENLKYFDSVFLYGYKKSFFGSGTWNILNDYVRKGGKLIIETGQKVDETQNPSLPEVFPVQKTDTTVADKSFNIEVKENDLTKDVQLSDFSQLKTKYLPYLISQATPESLKDWAKPVLMKDGNVVLAFGQLDKGSVVWSGINLPFHAIDNRNISETVIFANILEWFFPNQEAAIDNFKVSHPTPEKIIVSSSQGKGFLLKENYNPGWSAKLNGKKIKIYKAGLFQMYIPFDSDKGEQVVELNYFGNPLHWVLFIISFVSLLGVFSYLLFNKNPLFWIGRLLKIRNFISHFKITDKKEEENY